MVCAGSQKLLTAKKSKLRLEIQSRLIGNTYYESLSAEAQMTESARKLVDKSQPATVSLVDVHTRFLYPFSFSRRNVASAVECLQKLEFKGGRRVWTLCDLESVHNEYYTTEALESSLKSIFGPKGAGRYLAVPPETANSMFSRKLVLPQKNSYPSQLIQFVQPKPAAEVFLSPFGVGVLSLTFKLDFEQQTAATVNDALMFNYRLSQLRDWMTTALRIPHPSDDSNKWASIPLDQQAKIPASPASESELKDRLNVPGGEYLTSELVGYLLKPLSSDIEFRAGTAQFNVYTVVRLDKQVDFAHETTRRLLSPALSGLAQVEEHIHAGSIPGEPGIVNEILNRHHWAGLGCLGAVHLVSDQEGDVAFNEERLQRSRDRYFIPYLSAYMQRLAVQRASDIVGHTIQQPSANNLEACAPEFRKVLRDLIEFNAVTYLPEVSRREVLNRYYRLAQNGLQVQRAWEMTSESIANLEAACRVLQQERQLWESAALLEKQNDILTESKDLHAKVEWVEVFIVAVYFAELVHIVGGSLFEHSYVGWSALIGSTGAMTLALLVLRPWHSLPLKGLKLVGLIAFLAMTLFLVVGVLKFPQAHRESGQPEKSHDSSHEKTDPPPVR